MAGGSCPGRAAASSKSARTGASLGAFEVGRRGLLALAYAPGGRSLACAVADGPVKIIDADNGAEVARLRAVQDWASLGRSDSLSHCSFSPDGRRLLANSNARISLWDAASFQPVALASEGGGSLYRCRHTADGRYLTYRTHDAVGIRDAETLKELCRAPVAGRISAFDCGAAGRFFCVGSDMGAIYLLRVENLQVGAPGPSPAIFPGLQRGAISALSQ